MPKLSPLDDQNTYYKYAREAQDRLDALGKEIAAKKQKASGIFGKGGAVTDNVGDMPRGPDEWKAADAAHDHLVNIKESAQEDAVASRNMALAKINELNGNTARAEKERARRWPKK